MRVQTAPQNIKYTSPANTTRIAGGCPHGSPAGTCPICTGMGGGGGSSIKQKPTPKELGLLTWADLLPVWYAMQAAKLRKENDQKLEKLMEMKTALEKNSIYQTTIKFIDTKIMPLVKLLDSKVLTPLAKNANQVMQAVNTFFTELKTQIIQQLAKAGVVISQKLNELLDKLKQMPEIFKNAMAQFLSNIKEKEKALREFLLDMADKFKKRIFHLIEMVDASMEQGENKNNPFRIYEELENV